MGEPYSLDSMKETLDHIDKRTKLIRDGTRYTRDRIEHYDNLEVDTPRFDAMPVEPDVVVKTINNAVGDLNKEMQYHLGEEMQLLEEKQAVLEERQGEMLFCIKDMHRTLKQLHAQSSELAENLQRQAKDAKRNKKAMAMKNGERQLMQAGMCGACSTVQQRPSSPSGGLARTKTRRMTGGEL